MVSENKIREMINKDLELLEKFAEEERTNIYRDHIVEADRLIHRVSVMYEILQEAPSERASNLVSISKDKLLEV